MKIDVSDPGYENYSGSKTFKVTPISVSVSNDNSIKSNSDTPFIIPSDSFNSLSTPDNVKRHHHIHHNNHSTIISSTSSHIIPSNNLITEAVYQLICLFVTLSARFTTNFRQNAVIEFTPR